MLNLDRKSLDREFGVWCCANRCSRRVHPGWPVCSYHLGMVPSRMLPDIRGLDAQGALYAPDNEDTLRALELADAAIVAIAKAERGASINTWGIRAAMTKQVLANGPEPAPAVQGVLLEEHPDMNGAYGAEGKRR